jgi:hypothetical protein
MRGQVAQEEHSIEVVVVMSSSLNKVFMNVIVEFPFIDVHMRPLNIFKLLIDNALNLLLHLVS